MRRFLAFLAFVLFCLTPAAAEAAEREWIQEIAVLPPSDGWESDQGRSVLLALRLAEKEVNTSAEGAGGRDIRFVRLDPGSGVGELKRPDVRVVLASGPDLPEDLAALFLRGWTGPPVILAGGERVEFSPRDAPWLYALDFFQDFRANAFARYATLHLPKESTVAILSDNLGDDSRRGASLTRMFLEESGFKVFPLFFPGQGENAFQFVMQEIRDSGAKAVVVWLGSMSAMDLWHVSARSGIAMEFWNASDREELLRLFDGMTVVSQDPAGRSPFLELARRFRLEFGERPKDLLAAARVYACARWIIAALSRVNASGASLDVSLSTMSGIPYGRETLSINPATHRPQTRSVRVSRASSKAWRQEAEFDVPAWETAY